MALAHRYLWVDEVRLHYVEAGTGDRTVLLLHGFPEFWYTWRHLIPHLVDRGFRVIAPDQRGYNLSDRPAGIRPYRVEKLYGDIAQLLQRLELERVCVVAHDWGGGIGWYLAMHHPELVERLVILDSPHPKRFAEAIFKFPQLLKSWYMFFFLIPWLPELLMRAFRHWAPRKNFEAESSNPDAYTAEDLVRYQAAWRQPHVWNRMINWYRALVSRGPRGVAHLLRVVEQPVLILWGKKDKALGHQMAQPEPEWVPNVEVIKLDDAGHFVHLDAPERVNALISDFLTR